MAKKDRNTEEYDGLLDAALFEPVAYRLPTHDFYKPHDQCGMSEWPPSLTRQEFAEECDINEIMARYQVTDMSALNAPVGPPTYVDFVNMPNNLQDAMEQVFTAEREFMRLPANVRREFDNDPVKFVAFASDHANLDQMRDWGLAPQPQEAADLGSAPQAPPASPGAPASPGGAATQ